MKPVKIYTYSQWRPDFISLQYKTLKRFVKDDFEFIVFNNGVNSASQREAVAKACSEIGVKCIDVQLEESLRVQGGQTTFRNEGYADANLACSYPLVWSWKILSEQNGFIVSVIDSDMFFIRDFSFNDAIKKATFSFVPQYRGISPSQESAEVFYPWNGFFIIDVDNMPEMHELFWHCGEVNGHRVDVGGQGHHYLKKYVHKLTMGFFDIYCIYEIEKKNGYIDIHYTQNGNSNFWLEYAEARSAIRITEPHQNIHGRIFPYEKVSDNYLVVKAQKAKSLYEDFIKDKQTYPDPTYIDFLEEYDSSYPVRNNPFIIHYKSGSNYNGLSSGYHSAKTSFLMKFIEGRMDNG